MHRTYAFMEVVGTGPSVDEAIRSAIERVSLDVRKVDWFEMTQVRGYVREGAVDHLQVSLKVGYRLED